MSIANIRYNRESAVITAYAKVTTTVQFTTASGYKYGDVFSTAGFGSGVFITRVASNTTAAPKCYLQARVDTTTYANVATIHTDFTTTANAKYKYVEGLPDYCRVALQAATTTSKVKVGVKCLLKVI